MRLVRKPPPRSLAAQQKQLIFVGSALDDLSAFSDDVKLTMGMALNVACLGGKHPNAKPWHGLGSGAFEIVERDEAGTYRAVYTVEFGDSVYVLHAFQKKSKSGIKTPQLEIDLVRGRYQAARDDYLARKAKAKGQ